VGFLPRFNVGIFHGEDPTGKTGHPGRISARFLAGSCQDLGTHFTRVILFGEMLFGEFLKGH